MNNVAVRKDPMANYNLLNEEQKGMVDKAASLVFDMLGGENVSINVLLGFADAVRPMMKIAKNNSGAYAKQLTRPAKILDGDAAIRIKKYLREGDVVSYLLKSKKVVFEDLRIVKITDKRINVYVSPETPAVYGLKRRPAGEMPKDLDLKFGTKYIDYNSIQMINGMDVYEFLALKEKAKSFNGRKVEKIA